MSEGPLLKIENLKVSFFTRDGEVEAVRGLNLSLKRGEALAVVGESGCGKSVTAQTIMRLLPEPPCRIKEGSILMDGTDLVKADEKTMEKIRGGKIGMIFQDPMTSLNPTMGVGKQVSEGIRLHKKVKRKEAYRQAVNMLKEVRIPEAEERAKQYPLAFSGGMRQRAMIGLSIACIPELLIADEPTTALDVTIQAQIIDLLKSIQSAEKMSIIFITHDLGVAAGIAQRVAVMYAGRIVEQGEADDIFFHSLHPYTRGLMKSLPRPDQPREEDLSTIEGAPPSLLSPPEGCAFAPRCKYCMNICRLKEPPSVETGKGHICECWLLDERSPVKIGDLEDV